MHTLTWRKLRPRGKEPAGRMSAASCMIDNTMFILGGINISGALSDTCLLKLSQDPSLTFWSSPRIEQRPKPRQEAALAYYHGRVILFGGVGKIEDSVHVFDPREETWTKAVRRGEDGYEPDKSIEIKGVAAIARRGHTMTLMHDESVLVYGGHSGDYAKFPSPIKLKLERP